MVEVRALGKSGIVLNVGGRPVVDLTSSQLPQAIPGMRYKYGTCNFVLISRTMAEVKAKTTMKNLPRATTGIIGVKGMKSPETVHSWPPCVVRATRNSARFK